MITKPKKYTEEFVLEEVEDILHAIQIDEEIVFLGQLFDKKPYSSQRFSEWNNTFKGQISETIGKIKDILLTRAVVGGLKNSLSANMTKFHLINNYDWKDKSEVDQNISGDWFSELHKNANNKQNKDGDTGGLPSDVS